MKHSSQKDLLYLPQSVDTWLFVIRPLRTWILSKIKEPVRPFLMIIFNRTMGIIQSFSITEKFDRQICRKALLSVMTHPQKELKLQPQRPTKVIFEDRDLLQALAPTLQKLGIQATYHPQNEQFDILLRELEAKMNDNKPEIPGIFSGKEVTPKIVGNLFEAAVGFYRAAPWIQLSNDDILSIRVLPQNEPYYVTVMGQGGVEYGITLHLSWADIERIYLPYDHPMEIVPAEGSHVFFFNEPVDLSFDDLDAIEKYGWKIADKQSYPFPVIFEHPNHVKRPDKDELLWYEVVLRAIPEFVQKHLIKNSDGYLQPVEVMVEVPTSMGQKTVEIKFPAGELVLEKKPVENPDEGFTAGNIPIPFDRRAMEGDMLHMFEPSEDNDDDPRFQKAQELMYQAWNEKNPAKRLVIAHQALKESEDCTDAYVLLAEEEAGSLGQAMDYYQKGVDVGERILGREFFKKNTGHFWGLLKTRPYMRALEGKASCLWQLKRRDEALMVYQEILRLNPNDNQGIRYALVDLLLSMNRDEELERLMMQYKKDWSAVWLYTRALLAFKKSGVSTMVSRKLKEALEQNQFVCDYLVGRKRIPNSIPDRIEWGSESEAIDYAANHLNYWRSTPGAIEWIQNQTYKGSIKSQQPSEKKSESR